MQLAPNKKYAAVLLPVIFFAFLWVYLSEVMFYVAASEGQKPISNIDEGTF